MARHRAICDIAAGLHHHAWSRVYLQGIHDDFLQKKGDARYSRVIEVSGIAE